MSNVRIAESPEAKQRRMTPPSSTGSRLYSFSTLRFKGIAFSPIHIRRLVKAGKFPRPLYLSPRRPVWTESQLDAWIEERLGERDEKQVKKDKRIT